MRLETTIKVNKKIMKLIESKYPKGSLYDLVTTEACYYRRLKLDTEEAEQYLNINKSK